MTTLKISIPVARRNNLAHLELTGNIEVSTDNFDPLSQDYKDIKPQIGDLLFIANAENKIVAYLQKIKLKGAKRMRDFVFLQIKIAVLTSNWSV
jgi:hypothetical protein